MTVKRVTATILCIFFLFTGASAFLIFLLPHSFSEGKHFLMTKWVVLFLLAAGIFTGLIAYKNKTRKFSFTEEINSVNGLWGILFVLTGGALGVLSIFTSPTGGDEGMWANVVRNLILYSHYALGQPGSFQDFSPVISVGPTVILPLAFLYRWTPAGLLVFRIYALSWFLVALVMIYLLYARLLKGWQLVLGLATALIFFYNPAIQAGYSSVMGEMPALVFLIAGVLLLPDRIFLSGLFFGLAILTKLTLVLVLIVPFIFLLYAFLEERKIKMKPLALFFAGALIPSLPWFFIKSFLSNVSPDNSLQTFLDFILMGTGNPMARIFHYGFKNFVELAALVLGSTFFLRRALDAARVTLQELALYTFSAFFILWFFSCTDGHFARYMTYPISFLIPLAVKSLPENRPSKITPRLFVTGIFFLLLFHTEILNLVRTASLVKNRTPWLSEQLKKKLKQNPGHTSIWALNEFDGYDLAAMTNPPVFWMRQEMFFEAPTAVDSYLSSTQINVRVPPTGPSFPLPHLRPDDLIAIGVPQSKESEKKLYLLKMSQVPKKKTNRFMVTGNLPQELEAALKKDFESLGMIYYLGTGETNEDAYRLELWSPSRKLV